MTAQEAITALKLEKITIEGNAIRVADFFRGLSVANIALEKQIPKKATAKITQRGYDIDFDLRCPICGAVVGTFEEGVNEYFSKYCDNCGQALNWSEK